ncbi:sialic acid-binding Ig-like lectin 14 isoform X2 [Chanodichthys erythropterus]|uniref:sialic acid-binding Ig-like lectin 14 isoform X2 n=1 Tax=Chanodichthys erythropterus TaxID=933992 RepID=UPI00351F70EC
MFKMQIISSCTILSILVLNILCKGNENKHWSITFNPPEVTAVPGLCVLISCTFTYPDKAKPIDNVQWIECNENGECKNDIFKQNVSTKDKNKQEEKKTETERIKMLEPDLSKNNCSIIMKDIKAEDEHEYAFRVEGQHPHKYTYKSRVKIIIQDEPIMAVPPLSDGVEANLTCSAPFPCPATPPDIKWWIKTREGNITNPEDDNITLITSTSLYLSTLTLTPTSELHSATVGCDVNYGDKNINTNQTLGVMYVQTLRILGNDTVREGDTLSLICTVESHPPSSDPVWSFNGSTDTITNHTSAENLMITNVGEEHAGIYVCEMTYRNKTLKASITISVIRDTNESKINESLSPGGENKPGKNDTLNANQTTGMACSAIIFSMILCCWVFCHRGKKHKVLTENPNTDINLETVQTDVAQSGTNEQTPLHGEPNGGTLNTGVPTDGAEEEEAVEMQSREADYASIDYSLLKNRPPEEVEREPTNTDYAEVKRQKKGDGKQREALQDGDDQTETPDEKQTEGEEELYSNSQMLKGEGVKES